MPSDGLARRACALMAAVSVTLPGVASAQDQADAPSPVAAQERRLLMPPPPPPAFLTDSGTPFAKIEVSDDEAAKLKMPELAFAETPEDAANFDKYYYFHRSGVSYPDAYRDIVECDGYARGLQSGISYVEAPYPYTYTMAGAVGGMIGNAMAMAIFGSGEKRRLRRVNMRQCMNFKGYQRYGLKKDLWEAFHFEEGLSGMPDERRFDFLKRQALVAANATPAGKDLGL